MIEIFSYTQNNGKNIFDEWFNDLNYSDAEKLTKRIDRIRETGNLGDCKILSGGIFELRFHFGSGYRVYFGKDGEKLIILLCAGDKNSQSKDIKKAINLWQEYQNKNNHAKK